VERRAEIGFYYNKLLDNCGIDRIHQRLDRTSVFAQYTIKIANRNLIQEALRLQGIPTAVHYPIPLNEQPAYRRIEERFGTPVSTKMAKAVMSLPMDADISRNTQEIIVHALAGTGL
jgi:UDP-2-acetamido-2-deoxy-ribo-hexuluronate aminotransferase